jgi:hypothetical protein
MMAEYRAKAEDLLARVRAPSGRVLNPLGPWTAEELALDVRERLARGAEPGCTSEMRRAIVNLSYDSVNAALTLLTSSVDKPRVPRRSPGARSGGPRA